MSLSDLIHSAAARHPESPALVSEPVTLSYAQLAQRVDAAAALLRTHQVKEGDIVALALGQAPLWHWIFLLGALRLGAVPAAMGQRPHLELRAIPGEAPHVVAPEGSPLAHLPGVRGIEVSTAALRKIEDTRIVLGLPDAAATDAGAGLIEFAGLDQPRALRLDAAALCARCDDLVALYGLDGGSRLLGMLGLAAAPGIEAALATWAAGGARILGTLSRPLVDQIGATGANRLLITPAALAAGLEGDALPDLTGLNCQVSLFGAPPAPALVDVARRVLGAAPRLVSWAPESGVFSDGGAEDFAAHPHCVGRARAGVGLEVLGRDGLALAQGQTGLIRVRTPWAAAGYLDGGESRSGFGWRQGGYDTGLLGHVASDGRLCVSAAAVEPLAPAPKGQGTEADAALAHGRAVWSRAGVEAAVAALPGIAQVCVLSQSLPDRGTVPVIVYVGNTDVGPDQMANLVREVLGEGHRFHLIRVPALPRGADGAVDRDRLATSLQSAIRQTLPKAMAGAAAVKH